MRISEAARLLGVSDDTVRRWLERDRLTSTRDAAGRLVVEGEELAHLAIEVAAAKPDPERAGTNRRSSRNHFTGLVTRVVSDAVMSQVDLQCGPYRVVSLISTEAVNELGLRPGVIATAVVKATNVSIETSR